MATKIIHKKSSVAASIPSAGDLAPGELALNLADQKIYSKTTAGTIIEMAPQGGGAATSTITETCKNVSGGSLAIGTPVYASGTAGNSIEVQAARADTAGSMPAIGVLAGTLADEAEGTLVLTGFIQGINTSSFSEGDTLYVAATGGLTTTPPAGSGNLIQNIGKVVKVHLNSGSIMVTGAGRANATPNLDDGDIFIGNSSNQATTASLTTEVQNIGDSRYVNSTGDTMTGNLSFGDSDKAIFGAGSDLQIYHDGNNSYVSEQGQGVLYIQGSNNVQIESATGENMAVFLADNAVELYYDNSKKLATTSTGIDVTGRIDADEFIVVSGSNPRLQVQDTDGTNQFSFLQQQGSDVFLRARNDTVDGRIVFAGYGGASTTNRLDINSAGDVRFWDETGASAKLVWDTSEEALEFGDNVKATFGVGADLKIYHDGSNSYIDDTAGTGDLIIKANNFKVRSTSDENYINANSNGALSLFYDNAAKLSTTSAGIDVTGTVTMDGATTSANINFGDDDKAVFGAGSDLEIFHQTSNGNSIIRESGGGDLSIQTNGSEINFYDTTNANTMAQFITGGGVILRHNGSLRFSTTGTGINVTGTVNANSVDLGSFVVTETNGHLYFSVNGVNKMKLDSSGNLQVVGNVDSNATIT